ncbi:hypothetical protein WH87_05845 [Devosia epidermidihirudinis]|uniref:YdhG-like domain-containing protein n=1 Tax=Devosia epidermidihirudinis TaxID=1293439 RepID=A0A0F5QFF6_9HYPH|nr:hypothetical protein [Devosia epidermidihirudinis]KKC39670.1 hypothetical protein WH87_05845 [Devosia epidermidihirudinis]
MKQPVATVLASHSKEMQSQLQDLRRTILAVASETDGVGTLEETLKWGQVSYLTTETGSGTTVRIDQDKKSGKAALYVSCKSNLLERYRALYPDSFAYEGDRAVIIGEQHDEAALRHVIAMALTYHLDKKKAR